MGFKDAERVQAVGYGEFPQGFGLPCIGPLDVEETQSPGIAREGRDVCWIWVIVVIDIEVVMVICWIWFIVIIIIVVIMIIVVSITVIIRSTIIA